MKRQINDPLRDTHWEELEKLIHSFAKDEKPNRLPYIKRLFETAMKLARQSPGTLNLKIAATTLKELQLSFKMFYRHRGTPKITVFGSARVPRDHSNYSLAKQFGKEAVRRKYMIITGGGPGAMAAGNEGAGTGKSFGLNIRLPFEQEANPFIDQERHLIHYKYFYTRKLFLIKEAVALVLFPGGYGTFDEAFELLTLLQTGKSPPMPVIFLEPKGFNYWTKFWKTSGQEFVRRGFIDKGDLNLFVILHTSKSALDHIDNFYKIYHSMRIVEDRLVLRLKKTPSPKILAELSKKFQFLSTDGKFFLSGPLPEESNEPELRGLPRLVFLFERKDFSSLRLLIDFLNARVR